MPTKRPSNGPKNFKTEEPSPEKIITLSFGKAIGILLTSVVGSAGVSVWAVFSIATTLPARVVALEKEVLAIETKFMPLDLSSEKWKANEADHDKIEKKLESIETKIDNIRNLIK